MKKKWDETTVRDEALKYSSLKDFYRNNGSAYAVACQLKIIDELFDRQNKFRWNEDEVRIEAVKYKSIKEFRKYANGCYNAAKRKFPHLLDELFIRLRKDWTLEDLINEAKKYSSKGEFCDGSPSAYRVVLRKCRYLLDELFDNKRISWGIENVKKEASKYETKSRFQEKNHSAYNAAVRLGIIDDLFENQERYNTRCCLYICEMTDEVGVYKVGVTSKNMDDFRIRCVARKAGVQFRIIILSLVGSEKALLLEKQLKKKGNKVKFNHKFDGCTEFRRMSPSELNECIELIKEHTIERIF